MKQSHLSQTELQKRCEEVFWAQSEDVFYGVSFDEDTDETVVSMSGYDRRAKPTGCHEFDYKPDMTGRLQALAYLLGERDNFND